MTRDEALEILDHNWTRLVNPDYTDEELGKAQNMAIEALSAEPEQSIAEWQKDFKEYINMLNIPRDDYKGIMEYINDLPSAERKHGEWVERNVMQDRRDAKIPEWQSAKCSVCGKYHTTPYMYYFTNYDYCPNCGCAMARGDEDER